MPLKNRLEEVIKRYEKASTLVQRYKDGDLNDEDLGRGFKRLRRERSAVDDHNRSYIQEQRRLVMGDETSQEGADEESVDETETIDDDDSASGEDDVEEEEEDEGEGEGEEEGGHGGVEEADMEDPRERRLWRQYGSFWR